MHTMRTEQLNANPKKSNLATSQVMIFGVCGGEEGEGHCGM